MHNNFVTSRQVCRSALAAFTARTNQFLAREIAAAFPGAQILPALGNNDSGCGDYMSEPASPLVGSQGVPAVSPIFGNNPAFFVLALDRASRDITDYSVYTLTNLSTAGATAPGVWSREYGFRETYGVDGLSARTLADVQRSLDADAMARASFIRFYDSGSGRAGPSTTNWRAYWCGIGNFDPAAFARCYPRPGVAVTSERH